jgi:hypothetical protein
MTSFGGSAPLLVISAKPTPDSAAEFRRWVLGSHLEAARKIPGVADVSAGSSASGRWSVFYHFADVAGFERAVESAEAAYARGTWERWDDLMEERTMEVWAPLTSTIRAVQHN